MQIGAGLEGPAYWANGENAFIDQMKYAGDWITFNASGSSPWDTGYEQEIPLDTDGYPNAGIPYNTPSGGLQKVRHVISASNRVALGQYVFLYDGYGEFSFYGISVDSIQPNRIVLTVTGTGNVWMHIDSSAAAPGHARNFRLVPYAQEQTYEEDLFRPAFLDKVNDFAALRFMDWFHTNNNPIITWDSRTTTTSYSQADSGGIAYEYAIELCNRSGKSPWINIPAMADSQYIVNMAQLWHDSLDPNLEIFVEYSNEVWNFQFQQTQWIQQGAWYPSHWPLNTFFDPNKNFAENQGFMQGRAINIFRDAWGADSSRVKRVLGTQAVNPWISSNVIEGASRKYDYLSPTWYFGISPNEASAFDSATTAQHVIDTCRSTFYANIGNQKAHYAIADSTGGVGVIYYEGGQHISAYGNNNNPAILAFFDAQVHPDMYNLYDEVLDSLRDWGAELAMCFTLAGRNSQYGSWGHILSVDSTPSMATSPKYMALLDNMPVMPSPGFAWISNLLAVDFTAQGGNYSTWEWEFGDGNTASTANPQHTYAQEGTYAVCLTVTDANGCAGTYCDSVAIVSTSQPEARAMGLRLWPNPARDLVYLETEQLTGASLHIQLRDILGKAVREFPGRYPVGDKVSISVAGLQPGIYFVEVREGGMTWVGKVIVEQ